MAFQHGKSTFVSLDGSDLSLFTNTSEITREADSHDTTVYGAEAHDYEGGLKNGTASLSGIYDNTASTGPRAVIDPLVGTKVVLIRQPEGAGPGLPQDSVTVLVLNYVETNPVADMITWSVELQLCDVIDTTAQV